MAETLKVAMPKGRIYKSIRAVPFSRTSDSLDVDETRKLVIPLPEAGMEFILAKPVDVPTYVEYGVADIGIVGKDVLMEENKDVYESARSRHRKVPDVGYRLAGLEAGHSARVATKYPNVASQYFREQGQQVEVVKLNGSIELAPLSGWRTGSWIWWKQAKRSRRTD